MKLREFDSELTFPYQCSNTLYSHSRFNGWSRNKNLTSGLYFVPDYHGQYNRKLFFKRYYL